MKKFLTFMVSLAMAVTLCACGGSSSSSDNTLIYGSEELEGIFSPLYYSSSYDGYVVNLVYDSLLTYNYDGNLVTSLAKEMPTYSNDYKTLTFKIQKGIKFSDGSKLTSTNVKRTFEVLADKKYTGRFSFFDKNLVGYQDYYDGKAKEITGIKATDDYTVELNFTKPSSDYKYNFGMMGILSSKLLNKYSNGKAASIIEKAKSNPVGTGPYTLKSYKKSSGATLVKNENYWGKGYKIENVIIKPVDMSTEYEEIKSGNVDMLQQSIEPSKVGPASKNKDLKMNSYPRAGTGYISFNTTNGATADKAVRQALMYGFNRTSFVKSYFECKKCADGVGTDLGYVPATFQNAASKMGDIVTGKEQLAGLNNYAFNLDTAKSVLDQAGWTVGSDGIRRNAAGEKLTIRMLAMEDHDICNTLIPMWKADWGKLGVDFQVTTVDFNTLLNKVQSDASLKEWNLFFLATSFTTGSMAEFYSNFLGSEAKEGGQNYARLKDPELDAVMTQAAETIDETAAKELWKKAAIMINDDAATMPVYGNTYYEMYNKRIKNLKTSTLYPWTSALRDATLNK